MIDSNVKPDMDQILLELLVSQGFLVKQKMKNGKVWYKRTDKKIPELDGDGK